MQPDVVVVGAGPAGCATAIALRQRGVTVALVGSPAAHPRPAESTAPELKRVLERFGLNWQQLQSLRAVEPLYGISSAWGAGPPVLRDFALSPDGPAWTVHRDRLDLALYARALALGAVAHPVRFQGVSASAQRVHVQLDANQSVVARYAVDATGAAARVARQLEHRASRAAPLLALSRVFSQAATTERLLQVETSEVGWWYGCPVPGGSVQLTLVTTPTLSRNLELHTGASFARAASRLRTIPLPSDVPEASPPHGSALIPGFTVPTCERVVCVGDAQLRFDPLGSAGMLKALCSGEEAAAAIEAALRGDDSAVERFSSATANTYAAYETQRAAQYRLALNRQGRADQPPLR